MSKNSGLGFVVYRQNSSNVKERGVLSTNLLWAKAHVDSSFALSS